MLPSHYNLLIDMLRIDSTSGREGYFADQLEKWLPIDGCTVSRIPADTPVGEPVNLLFAWGKPKVVFCTHLDTVPPYIPPTVIDMPDGDIKIHGRGSCDAKGQIASMYNACLKLLERGERDFGLLLLYGEEVGSLGAKVFMNYPGGDYVIVGEPTDNLMVEACKGTKSFEVTILGHSVHSGYPQYGDSAVEHFVDFVNSLRMLHFDDDPVLGPTTYNIGRLVSDNPQNTLSSELTFRLYFRTTFSSDAYVSERVLALADENVKIKALGGDTPDRYTTFPGLDTTVVAFGSDAPYLTNFSFRSLCGPGSILVAHRDDEHVLVSQLDRATYQYVAMYDAVKNIDKETNNR